jgi:hypothetical protein
VPALAAAALILVALARAWHPNTLLALVPLGLLWTVVAAALVWRYGLAADERARVGLELRRARPVAADI